MHKTIDVTDLPEPLVMAIESLVSTYRDRTQFDSPTQGRPLGWLKGQLSVPDSFFEPLPDDVLDLFDGGSARMNILLDTATFLWICSDPSKLSPVAHAAYVEPTNKLFLSVASLWELIVKNRLGKLPLPLPIDQMIEPLKRSGAVRILPLRKSAVLRLSGLPDVHRDPFDRMLVCQAIDEALTILTPDHYLRAYPAATLL